MVEQPAAAEVGEALQGGREGQRAEQRIELPELIAQGQSLLHLKLNRCECSLTRPAGGFEQGWQVLCPLAGQLSSWQRPCGRHGGTQGVSRTGGAGSRQTVEYAGPLGWPRWRRMRASP